MALSRLAILVTLLAGSALADELHDAVVRAEQTLCEAGTGVSVSQSLKPSADGIAIVDTVAHDSPIVGELAPTDVIVANAQ